MITDSQPKLGTDSVSIFIDLVLLQTDLGGLLCPKYIERDKITLNQFFKSLKKKNVEHLKSTNN